MRRGILQRAEETYLEHDTDFGDLKVSGVKSGFSRYKIANRRSMSGTEYQCICIQGQLYFCGGERRVLPKLSVDSGSAPDERNISTAFSLPNLAACTSLCGCMFCVHMHACMKGGEREEGKELCVCDSLHTRTRISTPLTS